jgi:4-hydroxy 2-oxovalerate aldolase
MLSIARKNLKTSRLGIHMIPGLATLDHVKKATDIGVDVVRVATHCTEATLAKSHIEHLAKQSTTVHGVLMMSALISPEELSFELLNLRRLPSINLLFRTLVKALGVPFNAATT